MYPKMSFKELDLKVKLVVILLFVPALIYKLIKHPIAEKIFDWALPIIVGILFILLAATEYSMVHHP